MSGTVFAPTFDPSLPNENNQAGLYTCVAICMFGSIASTVFRLAVKWKYEFSFGKDDAAIAFSTVINQVANVFQILAIFYGFGRHTQYLDVRDCILANKYAQLIIPMSIVANISSKASLAFFTFRIINRTNRNLYRFTVVVVSCTVILGIACIIVWATQTAPLPLAKTWDPTLPGPFPNVWKYLGILYTIGAFGVITDLVYSIGPLCFLSSRFNNALAKLKSKIKSRNPGKEQVESEENSAGHGHSANAKVKQRQFLFYKALVGCGLIVTVLSILSLSYANRFLAIVDMTWILVPRYVCDMLERNFAVVIANAPSLRMMTSERRRSQYANYEKPSKRSHGSRSIGSENTATASLDGEAGPGTWFSKESVAPTATMEVAVVGGRSNASDSIELPLEGQTPRGLKIMKSVDITVEGAARTPTEETDTALPQVPGAPRQTSVGRSDSFTLGTRPEGPSRAGSTASLNSNLTGRYSLYPQAPPLPRKNSVGA